MVVFLAAQAGQRREPSQPFLGENPEGPIAQRHHPVASPQGREQLRQVGRGLAVVHFAVQFEPVDAGTHVHAHGAGTAKDLALGFDVPAGLDQLAHGTRHGLRCHPPRGAAIARGPQPKLFQRLPRRVLGCGVADHVNSLLGMPDAPLARLVFHPSAAVVEE